MTKKHFIALADVVRLEIKSSIDTMLCDNSVNPELAKMLFTRISLDLANFCKSQNAQFNRERWLGYIAGTNGPNGGTR